MDKEEECRFVHLIRYPLYKDLKFMGESIESVCGYHVSVTIGNHGQSWWYARNKKQQQQIASGHIVKSDPHHYYIIRKRQKLICPKCMRAWQLLVAIHSLEQEDIE